MPAILPSVDLDSDRSLARKFLPHQVNWILAEEAIHAQKKNVFALAEKSVRIGWSFCDIFKNVRKRLLHKKRDYLFATKDYPSAVEYVRLAHHGTEVFDLTRSIISHGEECLKLPRLDANGRPTQFTEEVKVGMIKFDNGSRIIAFSSNPQAMAVYGGDVGLDEFAKHPQADLLWETAQGRVTWGYDLAVWSAHDGEDTLFNQLAREARAGRGPWNLYYRVTIEDAVELGLVELINQVRGTDISRPQFVADCRARSRSEEMFQQAYMCNPLGASSSSIVQWSAIERCRADYQIERLHLEAPEITSLFGDLRPGLQDARLQDIANFIRSRFPALFKNGAQLRLGFDVAASGEGDLACIYADEPKGNDLWLKGLFTCRTDDWNFLKAVLFAFVGGLKCCKAVGDETGLGSQICWETAKAFPNRFSSVNFRSKKDELGLRLMNQLSTAEKRFPKSHDDIAADYFALRKNFVGKRWVFSEGANQFNPVSHCDIAWAGALASEAHCANKMVLTARLG